MSFTPFDKPIGERLTQADLQTLVDNEVGEGYYIEYKSIFPKPAKMGHSLASLANTYGGWYFVGIEEREHKAANIPGFSLADHRDPLATIRDVARMHLDPVPIFFPQLVTLDTGNVVLVVYVPGEQETPFVTIDGRIYRRTHDSSEPIPETSRYSIDRLVDNGRDIRQRFAAFCQDKRTFSQSEENKGWLNIYIAPYPQGKVPDPEMLSSANIETLLQATHQQLPIQLGEENLANINIPFMIALPTINSVILRHLTPSQVGFNGLSIELFHNGMAKLHIPLTYISFTDSEVQQARYDVGKGDIFDSKEYSNIELLNFLDIGQLWLIVMYLFHFYEQWLGPLEICTSYKIAAEVQNIWRTVAFVDAEQWVESVQTLGLPVIQSDSVSIPAEKGQAIVLERSESSWLIFCQAISQALGFPIETFSILFGATIARAGRQNKT